MESPPKAHSELKTSGRPRLDLSARRRLAIPRARRRKERVMKRLIAAALVVLAVVGSSLACNGANEVSGPGGDRSYRPPTQPVTPVPTPRERQPRPDLPCWKTPANC